MNWLKTKYYKWRCSRLSNAKFPVFVHKADGTPLQELELYKLALYINKHYKQRRNDNETNSRNSDCAARSSDGL